MQHALLSSDWRVSLLEAAAMAIVEDKWNDSKKSSMYGATLEGHIASVAMGFLAARAHNLTIEHIQRQKITQYSYGHHEV
jgi:hypothetical protein